MRKKIYFDRNADKEFDKLPLKVKLLLRSRIDTLEEVGKLEEPEGKKIRSINNLFEIIVKFEGQWRGFYSYIENDQIIILRFFHKKTQKAPKSELNLAEKRLQFYI